MQRLTLYTQCTLISKVDSTVLLKSFLVIHSCHDCDDTCMLMPNVIGIAYGTPIDMWSLGCIIAELYTGIPIFPGESEQDQLACIMEVIGVPPRYLIEQSSRQKVFFGMYAFKLLFLVLLIMLIDSQGQPRPFMNSRGKIRRPGTKSIPQALRCHDILFIDFIEKCLRWDPRQRMRPHEALRHEWIAQVASGSSKHTRSASTSNSTTVSTIQQPRAKHHSATTTHKMGYQGSGIGTRYDLNNQKQKKQY